MEKRACLGNNGGASGAPWTHKIVTICVTFLRARGQSCVRETRSWRAMCDVRDVHFMGGAKRAIVSRLDITQGLMARQESHPAGPIRPYQGR